MTLESSYRFRFFNDPLYCANTQKKGTYLGQDVHVKQMKRICIMQLD